MGEVRDLKPKIKDPSKLSAKITGLQPDSSYRFVVWARTRAGRGRMAVVDVQTKRRTSELLLSYLRVCLWVHTGLNVRSNLLLG